MKTKIWIVIYLFFNVHYVFSYNENLKQIPPKYNVLLSKQEYAVLINAIEDGVKKYKGNIEYSINTSNNKDEITWELTTTNKSVLEVVNVYVAQMSVEIITAIDNGQKMDAQLMNAISSLSMKLENAIQNPVYSLQTLVGVIKMENNLYYFISQNGDKRIIKDFCEMSSVVNIPIIVEGYIKNEGFIEAERYRFIKKNILELFIMSQCPYGLEAVNYLIKNDDLLESNNIKWEIHFIFYRNGNSYISLHGENELQEDLVMISIRDKYPMFLKSYLKERINHPTNSWKNIASYIGLKDNEIEIIDNEIVKNRDTLIKKEYEYVTQTYHEINASPTYVWEGIVINNNLNEVPVFKNNSDYELMNQCGN